MAHGLLLLRIYAAAVVVSAGPPSSVASIVKRRRKRGGSEAVAHRIAVRGSSGVLGHLELAAEDEVADGAWAFGASHALDAEARRGLVAAVCAGEYDKNGVEEPVKCTRTAALLYSNVVKSPSNDEVIPLALQVWEGQRPEDAVAGFVRRLAGDIPDWFEGALLDNLCADKTLADLWTCSPVVVKSLEVTAAGKALGPIEVFKGEEVVDAVARFTREQSGIDAAMQTQLFQTLCAQVSTDFKCTRQRALLYSASPVLATDFTVATAASGAPSTIEVFAGEEGADVAYDFATRHNWTSDGAKRLALELCGRRPPELLPRRPVSLSCSRLGPILDRVAIRGPYGPEKEEVIVGYLDVVQGAEGHDLAYAFAAKHGCYGCDFYKQLARSVCGMRGPVCTRHRAIAWSTEVDAATFKSLNWPPVARRLEVWEDEQVVDGVRALWYAMNASSEEARGLRRALSSLACEKSAPKELCERGEELLARIDVEHPKSTSHFAFNRTKSRVDDAKCAAGDCAPTLYDLGVEGWGGVSGLQVLGVRNDSEADRRGVLRGMRLKVDDREQFMRDLASSAVDSPAAANLDFQIVDDWDLNLKTGPISVYEGESVDDAVHAACLKNELLQPNYTAAGWQQTYREALCSPEARRPLGAPAPLGCDTHRYAPRFLVFEMPLTYQGVTHAFKYFAQDWPPCSTAEYDPTSLEHGGSAWGHGADEETLAALTVEALLPPEEDVECKPAAVRAAESWCERLGPPRPRNCVVDLTRLVEGEMAKAATHRWDEKATPDGPDLYVVLGVARDADNDTITQAHARLALELQEPTRLLLSRLAHVDELRTIVAKTRSAAKLLVEMTQSTRGAVRRMLVEEGALLRSARLVSFGEHSRLINVSAALRSSTLHVFSDEQQPTLALARQRLEASDVTVDDLRKAGLVAEKGGGSPGRGRNRRIDPKLELSALGVEVVKAESELRVAREERLDWAVVGTRLAEHRARQPSVEAARSLLAACDQRTQKVDILLRIAERASEEANSTLVAIDKPLRELAKRAHALHLAFETLADETNRDFYDRPCRPVFGACCVRDSPDGGMRITCG